MGGGLIVLHHTCWHMKPASHVSSSMALSAGWSMLPSVKPPSRAIEQACVVAFQTVVGTEAAAKWGVQDYWTEVWDATAQQCNVAVEKSGGGV